MHPHGEYTIEVRGQCIVVKVYGSWNVEGIAAFSSELKAKALALTSQPWAILTDLTEWELGIPGTEELVDHLQKWCAENNQKYEAIVVNGSQLKKFQMERYLKEFSDAEIEHRYFNSFDEAYDWLSSVVVID